MEHEFDVRLGHVLLHLDEGVQAARHDRSGASSQKIGAQHAERHAVKAHLAMETSGRGAVPGDPDAEMILKILADAGGIDDRRHAHRLQMIGGTNARQHQDLRRVERPARYDDLAAGVNARDERILDVFDAGRALVLDDDLEHVGPGFYRQVLAAADGAQIGARGGRAPAVADGVLAAAKTLLRIRIVILARRKARLLARLDPRVEYGIVRLAVFGADGAIAAAKLVGAALECFAAAEIGQHVAIGPALGAVPVPAVEIGGVAARVGHDIDGGTAAEHLAAHRLDAAAIQRRFGLRFVAPVMHLVLMHLAHAEGNGNERVDVAPARFQQQHAHMRVFRQARGDDAAGRAAANNNVIIASAVHSLSPGVIVMLMHLRGGAQFDNARRRWQP